MLLSDSCCFKALNPQTSLSSLFYPSLDKKVTKNLKMFIPDRHPNIIIVCIFNFIGGRITYLLAIDWNGLNVTLLDKSLTPVS
jgi:hypothetical protein